jgi:hypothetical protein
MQVLIERKGSVRKEEGKIREEICSAKSQVFREMEF